MLGRVSVCGKPIVSISTHQSEIIDFTWLKVRATTYRDLGGNRLLCPTVTGNVPIDLSRFLEEVRRTERCARKHVGPFENVSYSVGGWNGYLTRHEGRGDLAYRVMSVSSRDQSLISCLRSSFWRSALRTRYLACAA